MVDTATAAGVVRRYLLAKARMGIREREDEAALRGLEYEIGQGKTQLAGGILINHKAAFIIAADDEDPDCFAALVEGNYAAIPHIQGSELVQWRRFIFEDGVPPRAL